jgi:predicted Mrr-cat superfamily restriction endonuclease
LIDDFLERNIIAVALPSAPDVSGMTRKEIMEVVPQYLQEPAARAASYAGLLVRLSLEIEVGDGVISPDTRRGVLHLCRVMGDYEFLREPLADGTRHARSVRWVESIERANLSPRTLASLGAPMAVYRPGAQESLVALPYWME